MRRTRLEMLRDYCREMSEREHRDDCPTLTEKEPWWDSWIVERGSDGIPSRMRWRGPKPDDWWTPPTCDGCVPPRDRALFAQIADEITAHLTTAADYDVALPGMRP